MVNASLFAKFLEVAELQPQNPFRNDLEILNYALTLELLEAAAYRAINQAGILSGRAATYFQAFGAHEGAHVEALTTTIRQLGGTPVQPPAGGFNFSGVPRDPAGVVAFFQQVESLGASAYLGAAPFIRNVDILAAALSIHAVEAEHTAALADLVAPGTELFAPEAFATPRLPDEVMVIIAPFLQATRMPGMPNTGGGGGTADLQETLRVLGITGIGAAAFAVFARRKAVRGDEGEVQ